MKTEIEGKIEKAWDIMVDSEIATENELRLVSNINGYNFESMESVLYAKTGLRSFEQLEGERS